MDHDVRTRIAATVGAAGGVGTVLAVLAATTLAPWFAWDGNALSDLGVAPVTAPLFNWGLVLGGALALPYAWALWRANAGDPLGRSPAVTFGLAAVALAGVGLFPAGTPGHVPAALAFYLLLTATLLFDWAGRRGTASGRAALAAAALHLLSWAAWVGGLAPGWGLAVPELVGALLLVAWTVAASPVAPLRPGVLRRGDF